MLRIVLECLQYHKFLIEKGLWGIDELPLCFTIDASLMLPTTLLYFFA